jgi:hypothetical protein
MSEKRRTRRLQFGLRKLLLWTAVVAVFLGILKTLGLAPAACLSVLCWAVVVRSLRVVFDFTLVAFVASFSAAVLTTPWFWPPSAVMLVTGVHGGVYGFAVFALSEDVSTAIDVLVERRPKRHSVQIRLRRVFLLPFIYAAWFWRCWGLGTEGIVLTLICGTTASGTVMLLRRRDLPRILNVTLYALLGAAAGATCFVPVFPSLDDYADRWVCVAMYAITGGTIASMIAKGVRAGQSNSVP